MRNERLETTGIITAGGLFKGLVDTGVSSKVASYLYDHEKAHADADVEGRGEFGFYISGGYIVAFYLIKGERTPEELMNIASAPGFNQMSKQDWKIYNASWRDWLRQAKEKQASNEDLEKVLSYDELKVSLLDKLAEALDEYIEDEEFPKLPELLNYEFTELLHEYGPTIYRAYDEAIREMQGSYE